MWEYTNLPCLRFRQLQDRQMALQVHAGEKATPLLLKVNQVLKSNIIFGVMRIHLSHPIDFQNNKNFFLLKQMTNHLKPAAL